MKLQNSMVVVCAPAVQGSTSISAASATLSRFSMVIVASLPSWCPVIAAAARGRPLPSLLDRPGHALDEALLQERVQATIGTIDAITAAIIRPHSIPTSVMKK